VDSGASNHISINKDTFYKIQEQDEITQAELGDDVTYPMTRMGVVLFLKCLEVML
jgi:hypothetical protein